MTIYKLRDYQQEAVDACLDYLTNEKGDPVIVAPTGAGKSIIIAALFKEMIKYDGMRAMMLTHVKELILQNYEKVKSLCPEYSFGIYSAGLNKRDTTKNITFAGIQSVYKRAEEFGAINLIIVDECHLVSPKELTRYNVFINAMREINPRLRVIGLTATPYRTKDGVILGKGMFDDICYDIKIPRLISAGYLSPLITKGGVKEADLTGVKITAGDFNEKQMAAVFSEKSFEYACIDEIVHYGQNRKSWLLFCCDLAHAKDIQTMLLAKGVSCGYIDGKMSKADRARVLDDFKSGKLKALCNVGVLTTGFDHPEIDLVVLLRATISTTLYVQMVGRGMRVAEGKNNCLVLDFGLNIERHGAVDNITVERKSFKFDDDEDDFKINKAPTKTCPECRSHHHPRQNICPFCGYEYIVDNLQDTASLADILSKPEEDRVIDVHYVDYSKHIKKDSPPSLKVTYVPKNPLERAVSEWVCLEHDGFAAQKARAWWRERSPLTPYFKTEFNISPLSYPPTSINEALSRIDKAELNEPIAIIVKKEGKYDRIIKHLF